jgi:S1-C subfamily serine protease
MRIAKLTLPVMCLAVVACTTTYKAVGKFEAYNEVAVGDVVHDLSSGTGTITVKGEVSGMTCHGNSWVTYIPSSLLCAGQRGKARLTCSDKRVLNVDWHARSCTSGFGSGTDNFGNRFEMVFGLSDEEARAYVAKALPEISKFEKLPTYEPKKVRKEKGYSIGTGFFVSASGHLITNFHVIEDAKTISVVTSDDVVHAATQIEVDPANDIAVLKIDGSTAPIPIGTTQGLRRGAEVFTLGYPLIQFQGQKQKATFGRVNALYGIQDDVRFFQMDVPIQPGNSGGPLIDRRGVVVGIATQTLSVIRTLRVSGAIPQNVNYAVKSDYVLPLLRSKLADFEEAPFSGEKAEFGDLISRYEKSVVLIVAE